MLKQEITTSKSSFRIDFYDEGETPVRGKIEHLLTKKKKAFKGLDMESISAFLLERVPKLKPVELKKKSTTLNEKPSEEPLIPAIDILQLKQFVVIPMGQKRPTQIINHNVSYKVQLEWEDAQQLTSSNFTIYAKPLAGGTRQALGHADIKSAGKTDKVSVDIYPSFLVPGAYRLVANLNYYQPGVDSPSEIDLSKSSLVQVY